MTGGPGGSAGATRARTGELACGTRPSAPRRGESECGRVGPAFACEQAAWRGPSRGAGWAVSAWAEGKGEGGVGRCWVDLGRVLAGFWDFWVFGFCFVLFFLSISKLFSY